MQFIKAWQVTLLALELLTQIQMDDVSPLPLIVQKQSHGGSHVNLEHLATQPML